MFVHELLKGKPAGVATTTPTTSAKDAVAALAEHGVGALVVSATEGSVDGIISERDIVRCIARLGVGVADLSVADMMTATVVTCGINDTAEQLMSVMTNGRFRHVPVVEADELIGIVSIGDVVRARVGELEAEKEQLSSYISGQQVVGS